MRITSRCYREMEDQLTAALRSCHKITDLKVIHAQVVLQSMAQSSFVATQVVAKYDTHGEVGYAELVFKQVAEPNAFLYNAMVQAYYRGGVHRGALALYKQMLRHSNNHSPISADNFTYPFVLKACGSLQKLEVGKQVHSQLCRSGWGSVTVVENSALEMYVKCGSLSDARKLFETMTVRDPVSWNTLLAAHARLGQMKKALELFNSMTNRTVISWTVLISGYTVIGCYSQSLEMFHRMQMAGEKPDDVAIVSVLPACAQLGALELGRWIHAFADKNGLLQKVHVCNALIEMYAKCGSIKQACELFDNMPAKDVITWSTMISGLAHHGSAREAIALFREMEVDGRVKPNGITFLALLGACAHAGLLTEGLRFFDSMVKDYSLAPSVEHYGCMVDLLGRSGCVKLALELISRMPMQPDAAIWGSLLSACKTYNDVENAIVAIEHLIELEPDDTGNYVILANIQAAAGRWVDVSSTRKLMKVQNMKKTPGCSSIEVNNTVTEFVAGEFSNLLFEEVSAIVELLSWHSLDEDIDHQYGNHT